MTTEIKLYPPFWRLLRVVAVTAMGAAAVGLLVRLWTVDGVSGTQADSAAGEVTPVVVEAHGGLLLPVLILCVGEGAAEAEWSDAFARQIAGVREARVEHGRADVVTDEFAFELDRLDKWHEGLGQSLHYAHETRKRPALALIVEHPEWPAPLSEAAVSRLAQVDRIAQAQAVKLILLRMGCGAGK